MLVNSNVIIMAGDTAALERCQWALKSVYPTLSSCTINAEIETALQNPLRAVVLDDTTPSKIVKYVMKSLRSVVSNQKTIVIGLSKTINSQLVTNLQGDNHTEIITGKFSQKKLLETLSNELNREIKGRWQAFNKVNTATLENSLITFTGLPDKLANSERLEFNDVLSSTNTVVEAVELGIEEELLAGLNGFDNYTFSHCMRSSILLSQFGSGLGFKASDVKILAAGGLVHDIGKMDVPFEVLNKDGKLSEEEWVVMKSHVNSTGRYLRANSDVPDYVLTIAEQHHEKLDGTGYPNGLEGTEISDLARMACIVDIFGALTDERAYKPAGTVEASLKLMQTMKGHVDQYLLSKFTEIIMK